MDLERVQQAVTVRLYYVPWDSSWKQLARDLQSLLNIEVLTFDIFSQAIEWQRTGMRTTPAVELLAGGRTVRLLPGIIDTDQIVDEVNSLGSLESMDSSEYRIEPIEIVDSSGSHRYDRWSERHLVCYSELELGWSTPSRSESRVEYVVFDFLAKYTLSRIGLLPRNWNFDSQYRRSFPSDFEVLTSSDGEDWKPVVRETRFVPETPTVQYWNVSASARFVRLNINEVGLRSEGKYFCQLMKVEFWGSPIEQSQPSCLAVGRWDHAESVQSADQAVKYGLFHRSDRTSANTWHIPPSVSLPAHQISGGRVRYLVVRGRIRVHDMSHDHVEDLSEGFWITLPDGHPFAIENLSRDQAAILIEFTHGNNPIEVWGPRVPSSSP